MNTVYRHAIPKNSADCTIDDAPPALGAASGSLLNLSLYLAHTPRRLQPRAHRSCRRPPCFRSRTPSRRGLGVDAQSGRSPDQLKADLADADALVVRSATKVTPDIIAAAPKLRAIARAGTGVDNVHVETATARGIVVMNSPGANSISVAELAMAQILALARKLPAADASMKQGVWDKKSFMGEEIRGKVLGLAGLGRIGLAVARRARAFEMTVIAHDPFVAPEIAEELGIAMVSLDELCARADYLSLHLPLTADTRHIFNADRLARCKKGIRIVNTARGDLIDEAALVAAIQSGHVGGAALDVYEAEPTDGPDAAEAPAGRGQSAHCRVHPRGTGAGRRRHHLDAPGLPEARHDPQLRELPVHARGSERADAQGSRVSAGATCARRRRCLEG